MNKFMLPSDMSERLKDAVQFFWNTRTQQSAHSGTKDQGNRKAVTGGKQLDGLVGLISDILILNGVPEECIFTSKDLELPGFYRPNKKWDLLVVDNRKLVIALEFKSQIGPSFGNNFNNRTEEALGTAVDLWTAFREGVLGLNPAPWLGYFILLEDCPKSREPVNVRSPHFAVSEDFIDASYQERYAIFCNRLLMERQYNAACLMTTAKNQEGFTYNFPKDNLSFDSFCFSLLGAVLAYFA